MHPPPFSVTHRLSDWPNCWVEVRCRCSPRMVMIPVRLLIERHGDRTFGELLTTLRCSKCGHGLPAPVYLVAGHHRASYGVIQWDWAIMLRAEHQG